MQEKNFEIFKFGNTNLPQPTESKEKTNEKPVFYGVDNKYPHYLLKLYNDSPIHSAIINSKANYIIGDGLKYSNGTDVSVKVNPADTFEEFARKVITDYLIFNYFCVEVLYNALNQPVQYLHIPAHKVRTNRDKTKFWYYEDIDVSNKFVTYDRFKPKANEPNSKIFYFDGYFPSINNVYPIPEYNGSLKSIQTDIEIRDFNLNNIKNHFSVSTLITFFMGSNVSEDVKKQVTKALKDSYTGATGNKMIIDFQNAEGKPAEVTNISPNDWDKAYDLLSKSVAEDIYRGHQVTSPMLFGVKTEGQLGGATELEIAYEIFKNTYSRNRRNELESAFNMLFTDSELVNGELGFVDKQLFAARISETLKEKVFTINELRKEAGLSPVANGDRFIGDAVAQAPSQFNSNSFHLSEADFEKIKDMGIASADFEFVDEGEYVETMHDFNRIELKFETSDEIAKYILDKKITDIAVSDLKADLRKDLGINVSTSELTETLNKLAKAGVIGATVEGDTVKIKPAEAPKRSVSVMYSYEVREGLGAPIIDRTRPFCKKLIENGRLYTKEEIQTMSKLFGYDIFKLGGGYYYNPDTKELSTHCRHKFKARTVAKRAK